MPAKRAPKMPTAPAHSSAKKAPRPANTKKKQAPPKLVAKIKEREYVLRGVTNKLISLLRSKSATAQSIVDFIVGPECGLESFHEQRGFNGSTPFLMAVKSCRLDVVKLLISEHSPNILAAAQGNTAMHIASLSSPSDDTAVALGSYLGNLEMVRYLKRSSVG